MTPVHVNTESEGHDVDRDAIRAELEETRQTFHALLNSLSDTELQRKSGNRAWSVRQLMWHMATVAGLTAGSVAMAKHGRAFNPPRWVRNQINVYTTKWSARGATTESIAEVYDDGHARLIEALDEVQPDEWAKGSRIFGEYTTVEEHFHSVAAHFREHSTDIKKVR